MDSTKCFTPGHTIDRGSYVITSDTEGSPNKKPRNNAATGASAAGVRALSAQLVAFYFRAPIKAFFRTRVEYETVALFLHFYFSRKTHIDLTSLPSVTWYLTCLRSSYILITNAGRLSMCFITGICQGCQSTLI